ncbi:hypothetical protein PAHAL_3G310500 [Panicum hallii]|uniref:Uncharacterized protein n=1 Tax=Panicum hallii TaxID=206008 RepID=A0A2T8KJZ1_9POAL|nr:hypothetical protein PAHAL_3G310500 [Panicum hallii]
MRNRPGRCGGDAVACLVPPERTGREPPDAIDPAPSVPLSRPFVDRVPLQPSPSSSAQALPAAPFLPAGPRSRLWPDAGIQGAAGPSHDRIQAEHIMERSPVATPPEIEEGLSSGSPSARTPRVEVLMPLPRISPTNRTRVSTTDLARINRLK